MIVGAPLGKLFKNKTIELFEPSSGTEKALSTALSYVEHFHDFWKDPPSPRPWLFLSGPTGLGKTHLAVAICQAVDKKIVISVGGDDQCGYGRIVYWPIAELATRLRELRFGDVDTTLLECKRAHLLVFDDLGTEFAVGSINNSVLEVLNYRYRELLPTVLTTNLTEKEFVERYGDRMASRIMEVATRVALSGPDYRKILAR